MPSPMRSRHAHLLAALPVLLAAVAGVAGCHRSPSAATTDSAAADSALRHELVLASSVGANVQPQLHDVPAPAAPAAPAARPSSPAPAASPARRSPPTPTPTPTLPPQRTSAVRHHPEPTARSPEPPPRQAPPPPAERRAPSAERDVGSSPGTVAAGTAIALQPHIAVCAELNHVGDIFQATLEHPIEGADSVTIPAGALVILQVTSIRETGTGVELGFAVRAIGGPAGKFTLTPTGENVVAPSGTVASEAQMTTTGHLGICVPRDGTLSITLARPMRIAR